MLIGQSATYSARYKEIDLQTRNFGYSHKAVATANAITFLETANVSISAGRRDSGADQKPAYIVEIRKPYVLVYRTKRATVRVTLSGSRRVLRPLSRNR